MVASTKVSILLFYFLLSSLDCEFLAEGKSVYRSPGVESRTVGIKKMFIEKNMFFNKTLGTESFSCCCKVVSVCSEGQGGWGKCARQGLRSSLAFRWAFKSKWGFKCCWTCSDNGSKVTEEFGMELGFRSPECGISGGDKVQYGGSEIVEFLPI